MFVAEFKPPFNQAERPVEHLPGAALLPAQVRCDRLDVELEQQQLGRLGEVPADRADELLARRAVDEALVGEPGGDQLAVALRGLPR